MATCIGYVRDQPGEKPYDEFEGGRKLTRASVKKVFHKERKQPRR
jgi:hypothetical protein